MLENQKISEIAGGIARRIATADFERVVTEPTIDSEGNDALRIVVVLKPETDANFNGDKALDLLVDVQQALQSQGESRLAIIEYMTEENCLRIATPPKNKKKMAHSVGHSQSRPPARAGREACRGSACRPASAGRP